MLHSNGCTKDFKSRLISYGVYPPLTYFTDTFHQFIVEDELDCQLMLSERFNDDQIRQELSAS